MEIENPTIYFQIIQAIFLFAAVWSIIAYICLRRNKKNILTKIIQPLDATQVWIVALVLPITILATPSVFQRVIYIVQYSIVSIASFNLLGIMLILTAAFWYIFVLLCIISFLPKKEKEYKWGRKDTGIMTILITAGTIVPAIIAICAGLRVFHLNFLPTFTSIIIILIISYSIIRGLTILFLLCTILYFENPEWKRQISDPILTKIVSYKTQSTKKMLIASILTVAIFFINLIIGTHWLDNALSTIIIAQAMSTQIKLD
jgi:hypothetical protein